MSVSLGPFDSPFAPVAVNRFSQEAASRFPREMAELEAFVARIPPDQAADVFETSGSAGFSIMATGREFLPVGGFTGSVPAPSLAEFERFVAEGRVRRVTVTTSPLTRTPDLRWVVSHCTRTLVTQYYPAGKQATRTVYLCVPGDATRRDGVHGSPAGAPPSFPARAKSRKSDTLTRWSRPRPTGPTCWRWGSCTISGSVSSYSCPRVTRRTAPWARALRTHSASRPYVRAKRKPSFVRNTLTGVR